MKKEKKDKNMKKYEKAILAQALLRELGSSVSGVFRSINFALHWAPFVRNERHTRWSGQRGWQQVDVPTECFWPI